MITPDLLEEGGEELVMVSDVDSSWHGCLLPVPENTSLIELHLLQQGWAVRVPGSHDQSVTSHMKEWYIECVMLCVYLMIPRMSVKSKAVCRRRENYTERASDYVYVSSSVVGIPHTTSCMRC